MPDLFTRTPRLQAAVSRAGALADRFAGRAAAHDRAGTFPHENLSDLRSAGYLKMTVPAAHGGEGAGVLEMCLAQEELARGDGATALSVGWHLSLMGALAEAQAWPEAAYAALCRAVVARGATANKCASEAATGSPSRGGRPTTAARRTPDGWRLTGRKNFTTMAPALDYFIVSAAIEGESAWGWFSVPRGTPGVSIDETWDVMGMRATGSHDLVLQEVPLPPAALVERIEPGAPSRRAGTAEGWNLHIPAVYLGIARAARDYAVAFARDRRPNSLDRSIGELPHVQAKIGEMELALLPARTLVFTMAERWDTDPAARPDLGPQVAAAKMLATNSAVRVVDLAMRVVGGAGLSRTWPLERYYRDVRAGLHNPPMDDATLARLAQAALAGEPPAGAQAPL